MNGNEIYFEKEYIIDKPLITETDSIIDSCFKDCHNNYFRKFIDECIYEIKLTKITNIEIINLTISGNNMNLYV